MFDPTVTPVCLVISMGLSVLFGYYVGFNLERAGREIEDAEEKINRS